MNESQKVNAKILEKEFSSIWKKSLVLNSVMLFIIISTIISFILWIYLYVVPQEKLGNDISKLSLTSLLIYIGAISFLTIIYVLISWKVSDKYLIKILNSIKSIDWQDEEMDKNKQHLVCFGKIMPPIGPYKEYGWSLKPSIIRIYFFFKKLKQKHII
ncbi:MAG: hypothetical protein ACRC4L_02080 [Mycoplasma sp.]